MGEKRRKGVWGGSRPHHKMHKERVLFRKERLARRQRRQDFEPFLFLCWVSGPVTFLNARSVFSPLFFYPWLRQGSLKSINNVRCAL